MSNGIVADGVHAFGRSVKNAFSDCPFIREVRQRGFAGCVDLCPKDDVPNDFARDRRVGLEVCIEARKRGVLLRPLGNSIPLVPPILVQPDESEFLCVTVREAVDFILKKEKDS